MAYPIQLGVRLSRIQHVILNLLTGRERGRVFSNPAALDTEELLEELAARGLIKSEQRKLAMFTVRRAALALYHRELIKAQYVPSGSHPGRRTIQWSAKEAAA